MALSPNGRYLALVLTHTDIEKYENRGTAQENETFAEVWEVESQQLVLRLPVGLLWLNSVAFSGNGQFLAVGGDGEGPGGARMGRGLVWDLRAAKQRGVLTAEDFRTPEEILVNGSTHNVVPASQDGYVAITTRGMATVWKRFTRSGYREVARIPVNQSIRSGAFNSEGNRLTILSTGMYPMPGGEYAAQNVEVWESQGYWQVAKSPHRSEIQALKFQPGDQFITTVTRYGENKVRVWNTEDGRESKDPKLAVSEKAKAEFSTPDLRFVVLKNDKHAWSVKDVLAGTEIPVVEPNLELVERAVALTPDGTLLALGGRTKERSGGWVSIYKQESSAYRMIKTFPLPAYASWTAISDDRRYLAVSPYANGLMIIDLRSGTDITPENLRSLKQIRSFRFAPNGEYLAIVFDSVGWVTSDLSEKFGVWRLRDSRQIATRSSNRAFLDYIFSSGQESLLAVTKDNSIELFDLRTSAQHTLPASSRVRTVAFSSDGKMVAMGDDTGLVKIFETSTRGEVAHLQHEDEVTNVAFSNDGKYLATSTRAATDRPRPGEEHLLHVWLLRSTDLLKEACSRLTRFREGKLAYCKTP
jgi:WD40 repeat protein